MQRLLQSWLGRLAGSLDRLSLAGWRPEEDKQAKTAIRELDGFVREFADVKTYAQPCQELLARWQQRQAQVETVTRTTPSKDAPARVRALTKALELLDKRRDDKAIREATVVADYLVKESLPARQSTDAKVILTNTQLTDKGPMVDRSKVHILWKDKTKGNKGYSPLSPNYDEFMVQEPALRVLIELFECDGDHQPLLLPTSQSKACLAYNKVRVRLNDALDLHLGLTQLRAVMRENKAHADLLPQVEDLLSAYADLARLVRNPN